MAWTKTKTTISPRFLIMSGHTAQYTKISLSATLHVFNLPSVQLSTRWLLTDLNLQKKVCKGTKQSKFSNVEISTKNYLRESANIFHFMGVRMNTIWSISDCFSPRKANLQMNEAEIFQNLKEPIELFCRKNTCNIFFCYFAESPSFPFLNSCNASSNHPGKYFWKKFNIRINALL